MKGKIITIIGIVIVILTVASYFLFEIFVRENSNVTAQNVVVAKEKIPEGTVIHNEDEARKYFEIKRVTNAYLVDGATTIDAGDMGEESLFGKIKSYFSSSTASQDGVKTLIGFKITREYATNEQILNSSLSKDVTEFSADERLYAIETTYKNSVAAEIKPGDYVDLWMTSGNNSYKLIGPLKIYKLKNGDNVNISENSTEIPSIAVFKLDEDTIEYISSLTGKGTMFFVKYGKTPTQEEIDNALKNAKKNPVVIENTNEKTNEEDKDETTNDTSSQTRETSTGTSSNTSNATSIGVGGSSSSTSSGSSSSTSNTEKTTTEE